MFSVSRKYFACHVILRGGWNVDLIQTGTDSLCRNQMHARSMDQYVRNFRRLCGYKRCFYGRTELDDPAFLVRALSLLGFLSSFAVGRAAIACSFWI